MSCGGSTGSLKDAVLLQCCHWTLTLICINEPVGELISWYIGSLRVTDPADDAGEASL